MENRLELELGNGMVVGDGHPMLVLAGPCVAESLELCLQVAETASRTCAALGLPYVFKASFDKANRTSASSFRGLGMEKGLEILAAVKERFGCPVVTDVHESWQCEPVAKVADILQIPAFLCRQTDLLVAAARTGRAVNVKKGQFLAPEDMGPVVGKLRAAGADKVLLTERGSTFGYHNLVVDFRSLVTMRALGCPVVFDATHSVQIPGGNGTSSGGNRAMVPYLARAAAAVGIDALFLETHPGPDHALSDGPNSVRLDQLGALLQSVRDIRNVQD